MHKYFFELYYNKHNKQNIQNKVHKNSLKENRQIQNKVGLKVLFFFKVEDEEQPRNMWIASIFF